MFVATFKHAKDLRTLLRTVKNEMPDFLPRKKCSTSDFFPLNKWSTPARTLFEGILSAHLLEKFHDFKMHLELGLHVPNATILAQGSI